MRSENMNATIEWLKANGFYMTDLEASRDDIIMQLKVERHFLKDERIDECDVRLVVYRDRSFEVRSGDVCYDTVHGIACGASMIGRYDTNADLRETADDLISQCEDQLAEMGAS